MSLNNFDSQIARIFLNAGMQNVDGTETLFFNGLDTVASTDSATVLNMGFSSKNFTVRGSRRVRFRKMKLLTLFRGISPVVYCYTPRTAREVADALIKRYGLPLLKEWFVDFPIASDVGNSPDFTVRLRLTRTNFCEPEPYAQVDYLEVRVLQQDQDVGELFKKTVMTAPAMPYVPRQGYANTELLTYGIDFTPNTVEVYDAIKSITTSEDLYGHESPSLERANTLMELMTDRLGFPVVREPDQDDALCLLRSTLVYHGLTVGFPTADTWYTNVLVFDTITDPLDSAAREYRGRCYVHYNSIS